MEQPQWDFNTLEPKQQLYSQVQGTTNIKGNNVKILQLATNICPEDDLAPRAKAWHKKLKKLSEIGNIISSNYINKSFIKNDELYIYFGINFFNRIKHNIR